MGTLLALVISVVSAILQVVSTLDVIPFTPFGWYQPKAPKSLLK